MGPRALLGAGVAPISHSWESGEVWNLVVGVEKPVWGCSEDQRPVFLPLTHPLSQWSHSGVIGSVFICVESRGRLRLYWPEPFALQQMSGSGSQSNGVETDSVGMADKEEQQGRDLGGMESR